MLGLPQKARSGKKIDVEAKKLEVIKPSIKNLKTALGHVKMHVNLRKAMRTDTCSDATGTGTDISNTDTDSTGSNTGGTAVTGTNSERIDNGTGIGYWVLRVCIDTGTEALKARTG